MKKIISLICIFLLLLSLFSCRKAEESDSPEETDIQSPVIDSTDASEPENVQTKSDGWKTNTDFGNVEMPYDAVDALNLALADYSDAFYIPVAYLGRQATSCTNYAFLCTFKPKTPGADVSLCVIKVHSDTNGNAEVISIDPVTVGNTDSKKTDFIPEDITSGYNVLEASEAILIDEVKHAFESAITSLFGVAYEPVALLGTQQTEGFNYEILCKAATISAEPASALAVVYVYASPDGTSEVTAITGFDF